jgi:dUTP pyrophosphatase
MVIMADKRVLDLSNVFHCEVLSEVPSLSLTTATRVHVIPYYLPKMRLVIYVDEPPFEETEREMTEAGFYVLVVPFDRLQARKVMKYFAHTVYWTSDDDSGHGVFELHEPKLFGDVGHDLAASEDTLIPAKGFALVSSNVRLQMPPTIFGWITARSSTARRLLMIPNGILDAGYRGPLFAQVLNMTDEDITIEKGDRVAQVIFQPRLPINVSYVDSFWMPSEREGNGFGSTGR